MNLISNFKTIFDEDFQGQPTFKLKTEAISLMPKREAP